MQNIILSVKVVRNSDFERVILRKSLTPLRFDHNYMGLLQENVQEPGSEVGNHNQSQSFRAKRSGAQSTSTPPVN